MKALPILLGILVLASCHREKREGTVAAPAETPATTGQAAPPPKKRHGIETPRVRISAAGNLMEFPAKVAGQVDAVLADIRLMKASGKRDEAISSVISQLAYEDPELARAKLKEWPDGLVYPWSQAAARIAQRFATTDPAAAADFILNDVPRNLQIQVWRDSILFVPAAERAAYFDRIIESHAKRSLAADLIPAWIAEDPATAGLWLDGLLAGFDDSDLQEFRSLSTHAGTLVKPAGRTEHTGKDPQQWLAAFRAATGIAARAFLAEVTWEMADESLRDAAAAELAEACPNLEEIATSAAIKRDPAGFAATLSPAEAAALSPEVARKLIGWWATKHPRQALEWAQEHQRPEAAAALPWIHSREPEEALEMIATWQPGSELDLALASLCYTTARLGDLATARKLHARIGDKESRDRALRTIKELSKK